MSSGASNFVETVDSVFLLSVVICVFFLVLITALIIVFSIKYNRKRNKKAVNIHGHTLLEITWTTIPTILVLILFWYGWVGYKEMVDIPDNAMTVQVTAQMWKWSFKYENGKQTDSLYVPVKKPVKLILRSVDVNHAFFVPAFRIKRDVFPGTQRTAWFIAENEGRYVITCAEYCGLNHSHMYSGIVAMPDNDFNKWYAMSEKDSKSSGDKKSDSENK
jgi:cytochrome c oxidase subunit 2